MTDRPRVALITAAEDENGNVGDLFIELAVRRLLGTGHELVAFSSRRNPSDEEIAELNRCDAALLCGTNLYQDTWQSAIDPAVMARLTVPVVPFGVGGSAAEMDDLDIGRTTREMIRLLHGSCPVGSVRDHFSAAVVRSCGVDNALLTGCPVLFWAGEERLPVPVAPARRVVITARNWLMHRWPDVSVDHPVQVAYLRAVLDGLDGVETIFAIHEDFDRSLVDLLGVPADRVFDSRDVGDYLALYTDPENVILANRLHAGMLAVANGVPAVFVGHDTRTYAFCEMLGLECIELFAEGAAEASLRAVRAALAGAPQPGLDTAGTVFRTLREAMGTFMAVNGLERPAALLPAAVA